MPQLTMVTIENGQLHKQNNNNNNNNYYNNNNNNNNNNNMNFCICLTAKEIYRSVRNHLAFVEYTVKKTHAIKHVDTKTLFSQ